MRRFTGKILSLCLLLIAVAGCSPTLQEPIKRFELQAPKPYGYIIGDEIYHRIVIETRQQLALIPGSIPATGEKNRWLTLKAAKFSSQVNDESNLIQLDLTYQVFYAPLEVKMLKIPGFNLQFQQNGNKVEQPVPDWYFTLSPLHEVAIRKEDGRIYLRPDAQPDMIDTTAIKHRQLLDFVILAISGAYLAYWYGLFPWNKRRSLFKQAYRQLSGLSRQEAGQALMVIHQALNECYRKALFHHKLADFYRQQPEFKPFSDQINWFFAFSDRYFFSERKYCTDQEFLELKAFCLLCRKIERGGL